MLPTKATSNESLLHWLIVRPEGAGQFTAQLLGLPELTVTAVSREEAIKQVRGRILEWIASGQLVALSFPSAHPADSLRNWPGHDPADPLEQEFLADLELFRREDLERTAREDQP